MALVRLVARGSAVLLGWSLLVAGGCAHGGQQRAQATVQGVQDTRKQIQDVHDQVDKTLASMNALSGTADLKTAFAKFSSDVDKTQSEADDVKDSLQGMRKRSAEYVAKWKEEMSQVTDPTLQQAAAARRQAVQDHFAEIEKKFSDAGNAYKTFYGDVKGIRTYLSNDLTPTAVASAKPSFDKATADGQALHEKGKAVTDMLDKITQAMPQQPK